MRLAVTIHCIDDEIIEPEKRERRSQLRNRCHFVQPTRTVGVDCGVQEAHGLPRANWHRNWHPTQ
jgi:hypothetical protein